MLLDLYCRSHVDIISEILCTIEYCTYIFPSPLGLHCSGSSSVHPCVLYICLLCTWDCSRYICIPPFGFRMDIIVSPHLMCCMFDLLHFLTPRGAGGGDGEPRDGGPPRETETPAQAQRALPVSPTGVFTCHTHQVHCCTQPWYYTAKWSV